jgi:hypothetical protein
VRGRLRNEELSFEIDTECACCGEPMHITMRSDLSYDLADTASRPMYFVPLVDFTRLREPSIVNVF